MQADYKPRALIGTYQDLGMIKMMTIISKQQVKQFKLTLLQKLVLKMISKSITIKSL
jgi:hypothetical protein